MKRTVDLGLVVVLASVMLGWWPGLPGSAVWGQSRADARLVGVEKRQLTLPNFRLESGYVFSQVSLAYETYGKLAPDGRNAVLITHGYTSNQHAAGKYAPTDPSPGWWDRLIGPGKAIDPERFFVVSSNMLGSSYGSTGPASLNPTTGKPYGPEFPDITVRDIVTAQHALLRRLGVTHLIAVIGPSYGGLQAFQWAVTFPDFMDGIVPVVSAPRGSGGEQAVTRLLAQLARDPNWHGGWYYDHGGITPTLVELRIATLKRYGIEASLAASHPEPDQRAARIRALAASWAREFDAHALVVLRKASVRFNTEPDFARIRAKVLYVLSRTDKLFPPSLAPAVMEKLRAAGVDATYVEIDSDFGHLASGRDAHKWAPALRAFLKRLTQS